MDAEQLRAVQAPLKQQYKSNPASAQAVLTARGEIDMAKLTCRVDGAGDNRPAGLHPLAGGDGRWACSADMLLQSLVACAGVTLAAVACSMGLPIRGGQVTAEGDLDFRGTLGVDRQVPVGFTTIRLHFELDTAPSVDGPQVAKLVELTERYCVIYQTLIQPPSISVSHATLAE